MLNCKLVALSSKLFFWGECKSGSGKINFDFLEMNFIITSCKNRGPVVWISFLEFVFALTMLPALPGSCGLLDCGAEKILKIWAARSLEGSSQAHPQLSFFFFFFGANLIFHRLF